MQSLLLRRCVSLCIFTLVAKLMCRRLEKKRYNVGSDKRLRPNEDVITTHYPKEKEVLSMVHMMHKVVIKVGCQR